MTTFIAASVPSEPDPEDQQPADSSALAAPSTSLPAAEAPRQKPGFYLQTTIAQVEESYAEQLAAGAITREQLNKITWLLNVAREERLPLSKLAKRIGYDSDSTLSRVFRANYGAQLDKFLERVDEFRKVYEQRMGISSVRFIETSLTKKIFNVCDLARAYQTIFTIYGDSQTGKSWALQEYRRLNNHGRTIYVQMPPGGNFFKFLQEFCRALGVSFKGNSSLLESRIQAELKKIPDVLVIIDEIHQTCLIDHAIKLQTIEYIRLEIYEKIHCGIVLCGTNTFRDEMEQGEHAAVLEQTRRRSMAPLQLPALLPREDMDALAAPFGLPEATDSTHDLRTGLIQRHGLRTYTTLLRGAAKLAFNKGVATTWAHFVSAHDALAKLSMPKAA